MKNKANCKKYLIMKKQTPIEQEMLIHFNGKRGTYLNKAQIREISEFLNAKVLEALERVEDKIYQEKYNPTGYYLFDVIEIKNIIEEVKPKYDNFN